MTDRPYAAFNDESLLIIASLIAENIHPDSPPAELGGMSDLYKDELLVLREAALDEIELRGLRPKPLLHSLLDALLTIRHAPPTTPEQRAAFEDQKARMRATMEKLSRDIEGKEDDA